MNLTIEQKGETINVLEGKLPTPYQPKEIEYRGNIFAPKEFFSKRVFLDGEDLGEGVCTKNIYSFKECSVIFDKQDLSITLILGEQQPEKITVVGCFEINPIIETIGINSNKTFNLDGLRNLLRKYRHLIVSDDFSETLRKVQTFSANVNIAINDENSKDGNKLSARKVESKVEKFSLSFSLPVFLGMPKERIDAVVEIEEQGGSIVFSLYSENLDAIKENVIDNNFENQKAFFDKIVVIEK